MGLFDWFRPKPKQSPVREVIRAAVNAPPLTPSPEASAQVVKTKEEFALAAAA